MGNVILHIGSPKTATTSFQSVLHNKCEQLTNFGFKVVKSDVLGDVDVAQFPEISEYILREELDTHPRFFSPHFRLSSKKTEFLNSIRAAVQSPEETLIISCEDLFHVNNEDEIELLISCLKPRKIIKVVCVLRERNAYLVSLKKQLLQSGIPLSSNTQSVNFIHPESWLVDYQRVSSLYGKCVGAKIS